MPSEMHAWAHRKWPRAAIRILIETAASGPDAIEQLKRELTGVTPVTAKGSKEQRVEAAAPAIESHNCFLPGKLMPDLDVGYVAPNWVQDLIEECAVFPNGMNDDQVDALSQALNWLRGRRTKGSISVANFDDSQPGVLAYIDQW